MSRIQRSPIFRNAPFREEDEGDVRPLAMNPANPSKTPPVTLALDVLEIAHQLGAPHGRVRFTPEQWMSVFYRGPDAAASQDAKLRAYERWKQAFRETGFDCTPADRAADPDGYRLRSHFCIDMTQAIPWAESILEDSARRAAARRRVAKPAGRMVKLYDHPVVKIPRPHEYEPSSRRPQAPCVVCGDLPSAQAHQQQEAAPGRTAGNPRRRPRWA